MRNAWLVAAGLALLSFSGQAAAQGPTPSASPASTPSTTAAAGTGSAAATPSTDAHGIAWVEIPAGTFEMGCVPGDEVCGVSERPRHTVRISRPFLLMTTEVTLGTYRRLAGPLSMVALLPIGLTVYLVYWLAVTAERLFSRVLKLVIPDSAYWPGFAGDAPA